MSGVLKLSEESTIVVSAATSFQNRFENQTETIHAETTFTISCSEPLKRYETSSEIHPTSLGTDDKSTNYVINIDESSFFENLTEIGIQSTPYSGKLCKVKPLLHNNLQNSFTLLNWNQTSDYFKVSKRPAANVDEEKFQPREFKIDSTMIFRDRDDKIATESCPVESNFAWYNVTAVATLLRVVNISDFIFCELFYPNETSFSEPAYSFYLNRTQEACFLSPSTVENGTGNDEYMLGLCRTVLSINDTHIDLDNDNQERYVNFSDSCLVADLLESNYYQQSTTPQPSTFSPETDQLCFYFSDFLQTPISWNEAFSRCLEKDSMLAVPETDLEIETILRNANGALSALGILGNTNSEELFTTNLVKLTEYSNCSIPNTALSSNKSFEQTSVLVSINENSDICYKKHLLDSPVYDNYVCQSSKKEENQMVLDCKVPGSFVSSDPVNDKPTCYKLEHFEDVSIDQVKCPEHFTAADADLETYLAFFKSNLLLDTSSEVVICGKTSMNNQRFIKSCDNLRLASTYFENGALSKDFCFYYSSITKQIESKSCTEIGNFSLLCQKSLSESLKILASAEKSKYTLTETKMKVSLLSDNLAVASESKAIGQLSDSDLNQYALADLGCTHETKSFTSENRSLDNLLFVYLEITCTDFASGIAIDDFGFEVKFDSEIVLHQEIISAHSENVLCIPNVQLTKYETNTTADMFLIEVSGIKVWSSGDQSSTPLKILVGAKFSLNNYDQFILTTTLFGNHEEARQISKNSNKLISDFSSWPILKLSSKDGSPKLEVLQQNFGSKIVISILYPNAGQNSHSNFFPIECEMILSNIVSNLAFSNLSLIKIGRFVSLDPQIVFFIEENGESMKFIIPSALVVYPFENSFEDQADFLTVQLVVDFIVKEFDHILSTTTQAPNQASNTNTEASVQLSCDYTMNEKISLSLPIVFNPPNSNLTETESSESYLMNNLIIFQDSILPGTCGNAEIRIFLPCGTAKVLASLKTDTGFLELAQITYIGRNLLQFGDIGYWLDLIGFVGQSEPPEVLIDFDGNIPNIFPLLSDNILAMRFFVCVSDSRVFGEIVSLDFTVSTPS